MKYPVVYCIAGNQQESEYHRRVAGRSRREWVFLSDPYKLRGHMAPHYVCVGTWESRPNLEDILYELRIAGGVRITEFDARRKERA